MAVNNCMTFRHALKLGSKHSGWSTVFTGIIRRLQYLFCKGKMWLWYWTTSSWILNMNLNPKKLMFNVTFITIPLLNQRLLVLFLRGNTAYVDSFFSEYERPQIFPECYWHLTLFSCCVASYTVLLFFVFFHSSLFLSSEHGK